MCRLNESPSEKEGKWCIFTGFRVGGDGLNESPSEKEGKFLAIYPPPRIALASMKALPKRKGNGHPNAKGATTNEPQ